MRIYEITNPEEQLGLLRVIIDNTWSAIKQQADAQAKLKAAKPTAKLTPKAPKKGPYAKPPKQPAKSKPPNPVKTQPTSNAVKMTNKSVPSNFGASKKLPNNPSVNPLAPDMSDEADLATNTDQDKPFTKPHF